MGPTMPRRQLRDAALGVAVGAIALVGRALSGTNMAFEPVPTTVDTPEAVRKSVVALLARARALLDGNPP
jgi:hypothetical protein